MNNRIKMERRIKERVSKVGKLEMFEEDIQIGRNTYTIGYGNVKNHYRFYWKKAQHFKFTAWPGNIYTPENEIRDIYENLDTVISVLEKHKKIA